MDGYKLVLGPWRDVEKSTDYSGSAPWQTKSCHSLHGVPYVALTHSYSQLVTFWGFKCPRLVFFYVLVVPIKSHVPNLWATNRNRSSSLLGCRAHGIQFVPGRASGTMYGAGSDLGYWYQHWMRPEDRSASGTTSEGCRPLISRITKTSKNEFETLKTAKSDTEGPQPNVNVWGLGD